MYEFELVNLRTNEHTILTGHRLDRAIVAAGLNPAEWRCIYSESLYAAEDSWFDYE